MAKKKYPSKKTTKMPGKKVYGDPKKKVYEDEDIPSRELDLSSEEDMETPPDDWDSFEDDYEDRPE